MLVRIANSEDPDQTASSESIVSYARPTVFSFYLSNMLFFLKKIETAKRKAYVHMTENIVFKKTENNNMYNTLIF